MDAAGKTSNLQKSKKLIEQEPIESSSTDESKIVFKTKLGRNVHRVLFESQPTKTNDHFLPNRMAYIVDLNDEETDVPITSIRSKADCPNNEVKKNIFFVFLKFFENLTKIIFFENRAIRY